MNEDGKSISGTWTLPTKLSGTWRAHLTDGQAMFRFQRSQEELTPTAPVKTKRI